MYTEIETYNAFIYSGISTEETDTPLNCSKISIQMEKEIIVIFYC